MLQSSSHESGLGESPGYQSGHQGYQGIVGNWGRRGIMITIIDIYPMNATQPEIPHMRGMNFGFAVRRGWYGSEEVLAQIPQMKALEIDWVAIHVTFVQETYASPRVFMDYEFTPDDREVLTWVKAARAAGLKVMLKPILEQFVAGFAGRLAEARSIHDELGLPLALLETGLRSVSGMKGNAADFAQPGAFDGEIQGRYMEAIVQAFEDHPWYRGFFWWKWDEHQGHNRLHYFTDPAGDQGFTLDGKPSEEALRKIFSDLKAKHG